MQESNIRVRETSPPVSRRRSMRILKFKQDRDSLTTEDTDTGDKRLAFKQKIRSAKKRSPKKKKVAKKKIKPQKVKKKKKIYPPILVEITVDPAIVQQVREYRAKHGLPTSAKPKVKSQKANCKKPKKRSVRKDTKKRQDIFMVIKKQDDHYIFEDIQIVSQPVTKERNAIKCKRP
ncbi:unnamed protein product [Moneuplotes crassus]|uniref:Uncharacterized protein n=1 Tax=Euplotes crassus TaxID=5936 RepID=A0AAD1UKD8_EUPCR|nr:unnamed protein product [Moneuplotes crassus]